MYKKNLIKKFLDSQATSSTTDESTDVEGSTSLVYKLKENKWIRPQTSPSSTSSSCNSHRIPTPPEGDVKLVKIKVKVICR